MVGPSGCGKSTTLRMIAGLEDVTEGEVYIGNKIVNDVPPKDRDIAMVFQSYALYPHMTVFDNMAFGLKLRKMPKTIIKSRVEEAARILDITHLLDRKPKALSGGQRQRVALGRAIVREPKVFLLDEPLSNLDAKLRAQMRSELAKLHQRLGVTFVYVTHDQTEAMTMADRMVVLKDGFLQQIATPQEIYSLPANMFVASFIGSPQMNFVEATLDRIGTQMVVKFGDNVLPVPEYKNQDKQLNDLIGQDVIFGIRPEDMYDDPLHFAEFSESTIEVLVEATEMMGSETYLYLKAGESDMIARVEPTTQAKGGDVIRIALNMRNCHIFDRDTEINLTL